MNILAKPEHALMYPPEIFKFRRLVADYGGRAVLGWRRDVRWGESSFSERTAGVGATCNTLCFGTFGDSGVPLKVVFLVVVVRIAGDFRTRRVKLRSEPFSDDGNASCFDEGPRGW